ncbi:hypothetical protein CISG_10224 [Coccidioides immitis RMSCC 3703]|uniref:Uncharacterized protein n=1 Tax=Coccidioides immitis RMSCC 3703 TaxID=454286 RepID=A0A0J8TJD6_COCIT|nr:hypothetical protein CISG_10224 [Coccidioides immitis RMSCC 3703]
MDYLLTQQFVEEQGFLGNEFMFSGKSSIFREDPVSLVMKQLMFTDTEIQLSKECNLKYQKTAKIDLNQIFFHPSKCHQLDQKNVERLHLQSSWSTLSEGRPVDKDISLDLQSALVDEYSNEWPLSDMILGLWSRMNIGSLHQVIALDCDEEVIHYLEYMKKFWSSLVKGNCLKMMKINLHTVEALELLAPGVSHKDAMTMWGLVLGGEAFSNFDSSEHMTIWKKLQRTKAIIPSLFTFFQDVGYLEAVANCLKWLVSLDKFTPMLQRAFVSETGF